MSDVQFIPRSPNAMRSVKTKTKKPPVASVMFVYLMSSRVPQNFLHANQYARITNAMLAASHKTVHDVFEDLSTGIGVSIIPG